MGGRDTAARACYLRKFDIWCTEHGRAVADQDTVEGWVAAQLECSGRSRAWMSYIRDFGRWRQATGHADAYVLTGRWKAPVMPAAAIPAQPLGHRRVLRRRNGTADRLAVAVAGGGVLHADALVRAADVRGAQAARRGGGLRGRAHRHHLVQGQPQPPAPGHARCHAGPRRVRHPIARPVPRPLALLRLRHGQPGRLRQRRERCSPGSGIRPG